MSKPKVSIIIPVYNVSSYLRECIDSVVNQTLREIEIIIVNDCSPDPLDNVICEEYAAKDHRIVYIRHEANLGLGGARNTGVNIARADYVGFVDSDDYILTSMYEAMYEAVVLHQCDIVAINYMALNNNTFSENNNIAMTELIEPITGLEILGGFSQSSIKLNMMMQLKLWKKSLFVENNILLPENLHYEDACTTPKLFYFAKRFYLMKDCLYVYRSREGAITSNIPRVEDYMSVIDSVRNFLIVNDCYKKFKRMFLYEYVYNRIAYCLNKSAATLHTECERYQYALDVVKHLIRLNLMEEYIEEFDSEEIIQILGFRQNEQRNSIIHDPWYAFGQLSTKKKCRFVVVAILKRAGLFGIFKSFIDLILHRDSKR